MYVDISSIEPVATHVWYDASSWLLSIEMSGVVQSIDFRLLPEEDFESQTPIVKFTLGCAGTIVVCHHRDGAETWLPVDMWLPGGFTPVGMIDQVRQPA